MTVSELKMLQALPLDVKVVKSKKRILEWIEYYGIESVYVAFSGGIGSTVLLFLVNEVCLEYGYPAVPALFVNTRNEFPEVVKHVYRIKAAQNERFAKIVKEPYRDERLFSDQVIIRLPKKFPTDVIRENGYLIASKKTSRCIHDARQIVAMHPDDYYLDKKFQSLMDTNNKFSVPQKYRKFIFGDIPVSDKCCHQLKHTVYDAYSKETGREYPFTGEQAVESRLRRDNYLLHGCNGYDMVKPKSTPLGFWTSSDLCQYVLEYHIPYPKCYGEIVLQNGNYVTMEEQRTGCMICTAGIAREYDMIENRYQRMGRKYLKHHKLMLKSLQNGGFGMAPVLDALKIPYKPVAEILSIEELLDMVYDFKG